MGDRVIRIPFSHPGRKSADIQDTYRVPVGSQGTILRVNSGSWLCVNWDQSFDFTYTEDQYPNVWYVSAIGLALVGEQSSLDWKKQVLLNKIKYLDERKFLDKSRIVPPKGIFRGFNHVPEVQEVREAGSFRQGITPIVPDLRWTTTIRRSAHVFPNVITNSSS